jgi:hypothetical protein
MTSSEEGRSYLTKIGTDRFITTDKEDFAAIEKITK